LTSIPGKKVAEHKFNFFKRLKQLYLPGAISSKRWYLLTNLITPKVVILMNWI